MDVVGTKQGNGHHLGGTLVQKQADMLRNASREIPLAAVDVRAPVGDHGQAWLVIDEKDYGSELHSPMRTGVLRVDEWNHGGR
jgi:hypothetical protein